MNSRIMAVRFLLYCSAAALLHLSVAKIPAHAQSPSSSAHMPDEDAQSDVSFSQEDTEAEKELTELWKSYQELVAEERWGPALDAAGHLYDTAVFLLPQDDPRRAALAVNYAKLLHQEGHKRDAQQMMARAREDYEAIYPADADQMVNLTMVEGDLLANRYDVTAQKRKYRNALEIVSDKHGRWSLAYADVAMRAGINLMDLSFSIEGERFLKDALRIFEDELGADHFRTGKAAFYTGRLVYGKGRPASAARYMTEALEGFDETTDIGRQWTMLTRRGLITVYQLRNQSKRIDEQLAEIGRLWELETEEDPAPVVLIRQRPAYPEEMTGTGRDASVEFLVTVDQLGNVIDAAVVSVDGDEIFIPPAIDAIQAYRFIPRYVNGEPVVVEGVSASVEFRASR